MNLKSSFENLKSKIVQSCSDLIANLKSFIRLPNVELSKIKLPKITVPKIVLPTIAVPRFRFLALKRNWIIFKTAIVELASVKIKLPKIKNPKLGLLNAYIYRGKPRLKNDTKPRPQLMAAACLCAFFFSMFIITSLYSTTVRASGYHMLGIIKHVQFFDDAGLDVKAPQLQEFEFISTVNDTVTAEMIAVDLNNITPAAGNENTPSTYNDDDTYSVDSRIIEVEAVLIPRENTVISSSKDSKIKAIAFDNGEVFKKGDILVEYECKDVRAEIEIAKTQEELSKEKSDTSLKLFKLDIISNIERLELEAESKQAEARIDLYESRMDSCYIRAEYDGRVIKRLANPGEFTRTDRVLMEVASLDYLKAEFLLPSRALRWVNVGAPIEILINETEKTYLADIKYIYGEVDPVSQSIQMTAQLNAYDDPLLPGMSGKAILDIDAIRKAGVVGFLEVKTSESDR